MENNVVFSKEFNKDVEYSVVEDCNPFGEKYLIIYINDTPVSGLVIDEKRSGIIEVKNKITNIVRINPLKGKEPPDDRVEPEKDEDYE